MILAWIVFPPEHPRWQRGLPRRGYKALTRILTRRPPAPAGPGPLPHSDPLAGDDPSTKERHEPRAGGHLRA